LSGAYGSVKKWFSPRPAPRRPAPPSAPRPAFPASRPDQTPAGRRVALATDAPAETAPLSSIPRTVNQFGLSHFPPYTGALRPEAADAPVGIRPGPYPEADESNIPSALPERAGEGEWLWNETAAPRPWVASQPSPGTGPSLLSLSPLKRNAFIPELDQPSGPNERVVSPVTSTSQTPDATPRPPYSLKDKIDFLGNVYSLAKPISHRTGISLPFLVSQASYETGWGKNLKGNNLYNLEADDTWQGPTVTRNGKSLRAYPSYDESMKDYADFLENTPRYGKLFETSDSSAA
jgi:hypothetical protein